MKRIAMFQIFLALVLAQFAGSWFAIPALAAPPNPASTDRPLDLQSGVQTAPVVVDGVELFQVRGISAFPASVRARNIASRIENLAANPEISADSLSIEEDTRESRILAGDFVILYIFEGDAKLENVQRQTLAKALKARIARAIEDWRKDRDPAVLKRNVLYAGVTTLGFMLLFGLGFWLYRKIRALIEDQLRRKVQDVKIDKFKVVKRDQLLGFLVRLVGLLWYSIVLVAGYFYLHWVLSLFPWTRGFANWLIRILVEPIRTIAHGIVEAIPDLAFLAVLFLVVRYFLKLIKLFFRSVADEKVSLAGFEAEWAWPTYRLIRLLLIAFSLVVAYPYIPGSDSAAFKGVSIFAGVLFSLGSSSLVGNLIAGYTMTYRRAFRIGDRIKIGEHIGDVEQVRLLVTHLRTPKNEEVIVPNSTILNGEVVNYSSQTKEQGLVLHTEVGIGYDTPWRQVEAMLIEAARRTAGLLKKPAPFVLQKSLGDFTIVYEINGYCSAPLAMNRVYTDLHRNIQDVFNEYGVQIMSPNYVADPSERKLVSKENWYTAPARKPDIKGKDKS